MYKPWTRNDTKDWIHKVESRFEDLDYYLQKTMLWCEHNEVLENQKVLMCCLITCIWVSSMRNEYITFNEIVEILGIDTFESKETDRIYGVCQEFQNLDHDEILHLLLRKSQDWDNYFPR